ncbi:MAG: beta-N-acetylglucosaminidase [Mediterranea massiliensis]|nr:beta-N-acetylglucosaminidase [Mediterranea massiliensis]
MKKLACGLLFALYGVLIYSQTPQMVQRLQEDVACKAWVDSVMQTLSLKQQLGQLLVYKLDPAPTKANRQLMQKVIKEYGIGGILFYKGTLHEQAVMTNEMQQLSKVPIMVTFDGEWGMAMRLKDVEAFPKNMELGCIEDDELIYRYGREVARQMSELGVHVNFAPVADVNINPKNPVINVRSFGEDPSRVADKVIAYSRGLEDGGVLSVSKHFPGHGDTDVDSHKALPTLPFDRARLDSIELLPFRRAFAAGLGGVMVGHLDVPALETQKGRPSSLSYSIVTDLLQKELGFQGLVFTDALEMKGVSNNVSVCLQALKAGNDMLLVPRRIKEDVDAILAAVKSGELHAEYIAEKCRKVLTYKYALGLSKKQYVRISGLEQRINSSETKALITELRQAAVTVVSNKNRLLPLDAMQGELAVLHVGNASDSESLKQQMKTYGKSDWIQCPSEGGNTQEIVTKVAPYKRLIVAVTAQNLTPYQSFFKQFKTNVPTIYLFFTPSKELKKCLSALERAGAVVLAHNNGKEVQSHVARLIYGHTSADGRLSESIGNLFAVATGENLTPHNKPHYSPEELGFDANLLAAIDTIAAEAIREKATPGCQVVVLKDGKELFNRNYGTHTYDKQSPEVKSTDVYDLASLTKTTATLLAVMKLYDKGLLNLTDYASTHLPQLKDTDKRHITISDLLFHQSGLQPTLHFYLEALDKESYKGALLVGRRDALHPMHVGNQAWGNPNFRYLENIISKKETVEHTLQVADSLWVTPAFRTGYLQQIADAKLRDKRYRYSCVGFILLQKVVEAVAGMPLDEYLKREFYTPMGLHRMGYQPLKWSEQQDIIPSATDDFLRRGELRGFVHDEAAAFQGGVSGNAGLFSNATEVAQIYQMLLNGGELNGKRYLSKATCQLFTTRVSRISRRGLGFDKPDMKNSKSSPCCESAPASVYGHTGFTGTCAWVDPDNQLVYVFLSNRICPEAWNTKLMKMDIRTRIQQAVYDAMKK